MCINDVVLFLTERPGARVVVKCCEVGLCSACCEGVVKGLCKSCAGLVWGLSMGDD